MEYGTQPYAGLDTYFLDNYEEIDTDRKRPVVLICPGGGYRMTSDREAEAVAIKYVSMGYQACVLRYSVKPSIFPRALCELAWCVRYLRSHADEYAIDRNGIFVLGFSAGGHLAASLGVFWHEKWLEELLGADMLSGDQLQTVWTYGKLRKLIGRRKYGRNEELFKSGRPCDRNVSAGVYMAYI